MRKRRKDPVLQKLRQLARAGKHADAAEYLEEVLRRSPNHEAARRELSLYLTGKPFSFEKADYDELQSIISHFLTTPHLFAGMRKMALKRMRQRVSYLEKTLRHMLSATELRTLQQMRNGISREIQRRRKPLGKFGIALAASITIVFALAGVGIYLWKNAEHAAEELAKAGKSGFRRHIAKQVLNAHDTGLNRTLNRRVGEEADKLRAMIKATNVRARELDAILTSIEKGEQSVVSQGVRRRAVIERKLLEMGADAGKLKTRWDALCEKEKEALNQQRLALAAELMSPLPASQHLQNYLEEDIKLLNSRRNILLQRINIFDDAQVSLKLPQDIIKPVREEMQQLELLLNEVKQLHQMLQLLPSAHEYTKYKETLQGFTACHYSLAVDLMKVRSLLPEIDSLRGMMQEHGQNLPAGQLKAAQVCLLEGGPTFSPAFPATQSQLHLLDELFTNTALKTRLYELTNVNNEYAYSEKMPVINGGRASFKRSSLDPDFDLARRQEIVWFDPHLIMHRVLDPRPLYEELGLDDRPTFTNTSNLHALLTKVLKMQNPEVPALAKAYVFDYLMRTIEQSPHSLMHGIRFAPEMRRTLESFKKVKGKCNIKLDGNCWLRISQAHAAAEREFTHWFHRYRDVDFSAEIKKNVGSLMRISPRFCGYINEQGELSTFLPIQNKQLIWYLSEGAMTTTPYGSPLQMPVRLSPVFIVEKQF